MSADLEAVARRLTAGATWHPGDPASEPEALPCAEVGGALVFAYVRATKDADGVERLRLHVSVHLDSADALTREDAMGIPLRVSLDGAQVDVDHRGAWRFGAKGSYGLTLTPVGG